MLHVEEHGEPVPGAPALVLLHAFPLDSSMWDRLVPLLSERMHVVAIDLPGLGCSERPAVEPSMEAVSRLVVQALDTRGVSRFVPFGISTGGYVALQLAHDAPDRADGLVLGSTTALRAAPDAPEERLEHALTMEHELTLDPVRDSPEEGLGRTAKAEQPWLLEELHRVVDGADPQGVAWMARAIAARQDTSDVVRSFEGPVLLLFGDEDEATPADGPGAHLAGLRSDAGVTRLEVLRGVGHLTALEQPEVVARALGWMLEETGRPIA